MTARPPARFITLEGGEGAGKSTQVRLLWEALNARGVETVVTREPGGSPGAESIRKLLVEGEPGRWNPLVETLLMFAARADHIANTIRPALESGKWVVCDRFTDSTFAYQGVGRGVEIEIIRRIDRVATGGLRPDLTIVLDLPVEDGMSRIGSRSHAENRFEKFDEKFHERLRGFFRTLPKRQPERCVVIDGAVPSERVAQTIWEAVRARFGLPDG